MPTLAKRYFFFILGLIINSFGVAFITKSALGTSQISSIPYVLSLKFTNLSFGQTTFIFNMLFILIQLLIHSDIVASLSSGAFVIPEQEVHQRYDRILLRGIAPTGGADFIAVVGGSLNVIGFPVGFRDLGNPDDLRLGQGLL